MQNSRHVPAAGALVEVRGRRWRLIDTRRFERCSIVTLQGVDRADAGQTLRVLTPFDRVAERPRQPRVRSAGRLAVADRVADAVLTSHPWRACWTAATANLALMPWQLEPALAMLGGATRVLLADAVGLGKTVQAGLVLAELAAHGLVDRTLVLTPAGLRTQWADELIGRFALRPTILDQAALAREAANLPADVSPWAVSSIVISSIDLVKRPEVVTAVDRVPFDLLIVDEAHHLTPGSDRGALVQRIASRTPWVVLISATPHSGDEEAYRYLTSIGGGGSHTLQIFRRSAPQGERRTRSKLIAVHTSAAEAALLAAVHDYARAIWRDRGAAVPAVRLVATTLARRAASSADAVLLTLLRRQRLLDEGPPAAAPEQAALPWEEIDDGDADVADQVLSAPGLARADEERRHLARLIDLARGARDAATKAAWITRWLARAREPVIVFSEYRDTIEALWRRFEGSAHAVTLHGGMSPAARREATSAFVGGEALLLLATDTGGEGLNLHARCRAVINNELPWNPMRLQQRVGRVDRIGQQRPVHAVHLLHHGSIEHTVLARLYRRAANAAAAMSEEGGDFEARLAETVLGDGPIPSLTRPPWRHRPMPEANDEARRLESLRSLVQRRHTILPIADGLARPVPIAVPRRVVRRVPRVLCAFQITAAAADGRTLSTSVVPISIALSASVVPRGTAKAVPSTRPPTRRDLAELCAQLIQSAVVVDAVRGSVEPIVERTDSSTRALARALVERLGVLRAARPGDASQLYQPALFDRRASRLAAERSVIREIHTRHLDDLELMVRGFERCALQAPVLIGAWLEA